VVASKLASIGEKWVTEAKTRFSSVGPQGRRQSLSNNLQSVTFGYHIHKHQAIISCGLEAILKKNIRLHISLIANSVVPTANLL
jgi:hypothetical protein